MLPHHITLRQGLFALPGERVFTNQCQEGLSTTASIILDLSTGNQTEPVTKILAVLSGATSDGNSLRLLKNRLDELVILADDLFIDQQTDHSEVSQWSFRFVRQLKTLRDDLLQQIPQLEFLPIPVHFPMLAPLDEIPTLLSIQNMPEVSAVNINDYQKQVNQPADGQWLIDMSTVLASAGKISSHLF